jgi:hypothetical protein
MAPCLPAALGTRSQASWLHMGAAGLNRGSPLWGVTCLPREALGPAGFLSALPALSLGCKGWNRTTLLPRNFTSSWVREETEDWKTAVSVRWREHPGFVCCQGSKSPMCHLSIMTIPHMALMAVTNIYQAPFQKFRHLIFTTTPLGRRGHASADGDDTRCGSGPNIPFLRTETKELGKVTGPECEPLP